MRNTRQAGFSLVELVIVIVILGLLAATAIPRFLNVTDDAEDASLDGVSGGLATAVSFVRSQWEVDGRNGDSVVLDGTSIFLDQRFGYPTGTATNPVTGMSATECQDVFNAVLQNAPRSVLSNQDARDQRYTASVINGAGTTAVSLDGATVNNVDLCVYHQVATLTLGTNGVPTPAPSITATVVNGRDTSNGITYNPATGRVDTFTN